MFGLIPLPYRLLIGAAILAGTFAAGFGSAWHYKSLEEQAALAEAAKLTVHQIQIEDKATQDIAIRSADEVAQIQTLTLTLVQEVPAHVSSKADAACALPVGFQRLHDAAAGGLSPVPDPAGRSDDAPAGIALSAAANTIVTNYGACRAFRAELIAWQEWAAAQAALSQSRH